VRGKEEMGSTEEKGKTENMQLKEKKRERKK
jgi:hypothetical protein